METNIKIINKTVKDVGEYEKKIQDFIDTIDSTSATYEIKDN